VVNFSVLAGATDLVGRLRAVCDQRQRFKDVQFKGPDMMSDHESSGNGIIWANDHIEYRDFHAVANKAVAGFAHLYAYDVE